MKAKNLIPVAWIAVMILPLNVVYALFTPNLEFHQQYFAIKLGIIFFMIGVILLMITDSGLPQGQKIRRRWRIFWGITMVLSMITFFALMMPGLEVYFGLNMPYVQIDHSNFKVFGYIINPEKQIGFMMLTGVLMMLPGRLITLAYYKLEKINRKRGHIEL